MQRLCLLAATALMAVTSVASATNGKHTAKPSILEIAEGDERLTTLVDALKAADLTQTFAGRGKFTLYAPTNAAFAALPEGTLPVLLAPENKDRLTEILTYHVDDRKLTTRTFPMGAHLFKPVLEDARMCITAGPEGVSIRDSTGDQASLVVTDIKASNGVIHVIDKVLIPGERPDCD